jgi:uncharacterized protein
MSGGGEDRIKDAASGAGKAPRCPICGKPRDPDYRPFCSKRCADVDLGRWFSGSYAIPVTEEEDEDGETPSAPERKHEGDEPAG